MSKRRTYNEACGIPRALDRVGERWALMIVRELLLGPKRFTDIREGLPGLSPDILAARLRELEQFGVVRKRKLPPPAASQVYELTEWGLELESVVVALGRWGARAPAPPEDASMSLDAHILSLKTLFDSERAGDLDAGFNLRLGEHEFLVEIRDGSFSTGRGLLPSPDATIDSDPGTLIAIAHGRLDLDEALADGSFQVDGDEDAVRRFLGLFPLPQPALA